MRSLGHRLCPTHCLLFRSCIFSTGRVTGLVKCPPQRLEVEVEASNPVLPASDFFGQPPGHICIGILDEHDTKHFPTRQQYSRLAERLVRNLDTGRRPDPSNENTSNSVWRRFRSGREIPPIRLAVNNLQRFYFQDLEVDSRHSAYLGFTSLDNLKGKSLLRGIL